MPNTMPISTDELAEEPPDAAPETPNAAPADLWLPALSPVQRLMLAAECPQPYHEPIRFIGWVIRSLFGIVTLIGLLAVLAAIPLVNFLALGYLLEVEGRVARSGRLRDAFPLLPLAPRIGSVVLGIFLMLLPLQLVSSVAHNARLLAPGSGIDRGWHIATWGLAAITTLHICLALARGGSFGCFFRPLKNVLWFWREQGHGDYWQKADHSLREFVRGLEIDHYFMLGLRGFIGALAWLILPTLLFAAASKPEGFAVLVTIVGGVLLSVVLMWVPFLQARFAAKNRLGAYKELHKIRELYRRAPVCLSLAVVLNYALSLPLFLATIVLPPADALRLVTPIFIVSIYPAKVAVGWAYAQAAKRKRRTWWSLRWLMSWLLTPVVMFYVFILFFTQFIGSSGKLVLFQHHTLLLPVPF